MSLPPVPRVRPHSCNTCPLHQSFCRFPEKLRAAFDGLKTPVAYRKGEVVFDDETVTRILGNLTRDRLIERRDDEIVILHVDELSRLCPSPGGHRGR